METNNEKQRTGTVFYYTEEQLAVQALTDHLIEESDKVVFGILHKIAETIPHER